MIVPYGAGGTTDLTARAIASGMASQLGVTINVNNVAGSGGAIGSLQVENAPVDGYSILANGMLAFTTMAVQGFTTKTYRDWDIWLVTYAPNAIVVPANSPESDHVYFTDSKGEHLIRAHGKVGFEYFGKIIRDCIDGTDSAIAPRRTMTAMRLAIEAAGKAEIIE